MNPENPIAEQTTEQMQEMITRHVKVDRTRTPQQVLNATGRIQYVNHAILATMPAGDGEEVKIHFFKPESWECGSLDNEMSAEKLEEAYERRGLKPDHYAQAQVNIDDPAFADDHPNGTQWDVRDDQSSNIAFYRLRGERGVAVSRGYSWVDYSWWFGGVLKNPLPSSDYIDEDRDWVP